MPRRGRSSAKTLQREPSVVLGQLDTTPTSHHAETLSDFTDHQEFFEDAIADEDLLALDGLLAPSKARHREKSFTWSEAGSTRRSSPLHGEVPNDVWEFDAEDSLPAMSSPKSGIDKLPATLPLPPQDHIEPNDIQPTEKPAHNVDFSETASTARRSTPFGLDEVSSLGPWEFETPPVKQTSLAAHGKQEAGSSRLPEKYAAAIPSEVRTNNKGVIRSSKQKITNSLSKSTDIDGVVLKASPTLLSEPAPVDKAKLQSNAFNLIRLDLESEEDMIFPSSPQTSKMEIQANPSAEPSTTEVHKTRKRKQRAKPPVKFDENTQQVKASKRKTLQTAPKGKRKRAAPLAATKEPTKKKPKIGSQPKANLSISRTPVANKAHEPAKATEKEKKVLAVENLASPSRLPKPSPIILKINTDPIVLSSDPESSEFIPTSPSSPLSSFEKQDHPQKGEKRPQPGLQISKSRSESLEPPQAPDIKPLSEEEILPDISSPGIDSLPHPIPTTLSPIEKVEEAGNDDHPTLPEPEESKRYSSRYDFQNGGIPNPTANEAKAESPEPLPSRNKTPYNNPIDEDSKGTSAQAKNHTTAVSLLDKRLGEKRVKRRTKTPRPKFVVKSSFDHGTFTHSMSPAEETQCGPNSRSRKDNVRSSINNNRSGIELNMNQSRTLSISEAGSPVRLGSQVGDSKESRYPLPNELEFRNLNTTSRVPPLHSEIGKIRTGKTENKPHRARDITNSVSNMGNGPNAMGTSRNHTVENDTQHLPAHAGAPSNESDSPRLQEIRGKIKAQMEANFEEQAANKNRPVAQRHNTDTCHSELPVAQSTTCSPLATGSIPTKLHRIVEVDHVPSAYMNGMSGALRGIERRFNRERRELELNWARDIESFKANITMARDKVTTVQEERDTILSSIEEEEAKRRLLYSRASSSLLALNRTLLNSAAPESSGTR
ncbi:unnamed protein product [Clonostachys rosea f. rosea IK726]|uniref:Uncharacterized protein n=1 Tax=Clonostachys rosea f. rosea IK726 TaxID=1349383 RepID=A0ACA9US89_BIOOC|nr:unnamed protein product [Clonostachys rosea f. rosea IK726]